MKTSYCAGYYEVEYWNGEKRKFVLSEGQAKMVFTNRLIKDLANIKGIGLIESQEQLNASK